MKRLMLLVMCAFVAGKAFAATPTLYKTLETDGRGFILTDYQPKTGRSRIEYDLRFLYLGLPFGLGIANGTSSAGATNDKEWGGYFNAETRTFTYYTEPGDACANFGEGFCDTSVRHTVSMGQGWVSLDDKTNTIATAADDYTTGGRFALFAANFGGTTFSAKAIVRVAGIRIFEDDTLVRDWVPAKDANGTATLYDLVNGKFETVKAGVFSVDDTVDPTWEAQAANGWTVQPTVPASIAAGTLPTISLGTAEFGDGTQTATYTAKDIQNLPAGTYTQVVEVASMVGYRGLREELTFTVTGTVPTAASTAPTAVAPLGGVSVATHTAKQQEFIGLPAATRKRVLSVLYERERAEYAANDGHPQSVRLRWDGGDGACTIHVYRGNETTPVQTHAVVTRWTEGNFFDLDNLEVGRTYRWTVTNEKGTSGGTFATEDETPRLFNAGVVGNTRDLGGYVGLDGRRVRQGMFLRSRCFDTNERTTYGSILTATEEAFFCDFIGLKTEIDLRGDTWITKSFVPGVTTRVNTAWPLDYTGAFLTDAAKKSAMKAALNPIFDAAKYPIDVHCHSGQDRTGMYCFILEALLGVSEEDCIRDWEYSALGNSGFNASDTYQLDSFLEKFRSLGGATTQAKAETFMKWLGYSSEQIDAFREIMLEPIGGDEPDDLVMVTFGDHPHLTAAWTGGDGSVTNAVDGTDFRVEEGTTNVRVIFTADPGWEIVGDAIVDLGTVTDDITFGAGNEYHVPEVAIADPCLVAFGRGSSNMAVAWTSGDGSVTNAVANKVKAMYVPRGSENVRIICTANPGYELVGESVFDLGTVTDDFTFGQGNGFVFPIAYDIAANVVYLDWDEANGRMTNAVARAGYWRSVEDSEMACAMKGCMVVTNDVTIPIAQVAGAAVLVLCNDATLTVTGADDCAGIHVPGDASLTITVRKGSTGRVVAQGGTNCAGIGSEFKQGSGSVLGAVRIVAGTVTATGGRNAAGIGNGLAGHGGGVKIFGGAVTAVAGTSGASDIGDGADPYSSCAVSISGGVFARPLQDAWCADRFAVFANPDPATNADYPYAVLPVSRVTIGKRPIHVSAAWTSDDGSVTNAIEGTSSAVPFGAEACVIFTADDGWFLDGEAIVDLGTVTEDIVFGVRNDYRVPHAVPAGAVGYLDWDAANREMTNATVSAGEWTLVTDQTRALNDGWYVVAYEVVLPEGSNIVVNGSAHLILCDGASLSITGASYLAAIDVSRSGSDVNSLAIYAQTEGTGRLTVQGGEAGAGIGGARLADGGKVTICGGRVTAKGGMGGSDIGGVQSGAADEIAISGGVFGMPIPDAWCVESRGAFANPDPATCADYPYAVLPAYKVTIGDYPHMTAMWTSGDGLVTNEVGGASFRVQVWEGDVRVIFAVDDGYVLAGESEVHLGAVRRDITFGDGNDFKVPHATFVGDADHRYCVIDLSEGPGAAHYPVSFLDDEPAYGWPDEYRTDKLVLRRIDPGTFLMGDQAHGGEPAVRTVTLAQPYFVGVFEVTQRQWELVMGTRPSYFTNETWYATRPVESVSYSGIRGAGADPGQSPETPAGEGSFLRALLTKTGIAFDLPTEAQWEYAARSGTTTDYGNGTNYRDADSAEDANMDRVGRYVNNSGATTNAESDVSAMVAPSNGTATVGSYAPNGWGLYDLHGNVGEICRDLNDDGYLIARGAGWRGKAPQCASSYRISVNPHVAFPDYGFRIVWSLPAVEDLCGLSFDANGGSCAVSTQTVANGSSPLSLPGATKEGHCLDGWYTDPTKGGKVTSGTTVLVNQTLYAHWTEIPPQTENVTYLDYDASTGAFTNAFRVCTFVTSETRTLEDGWYAVKGDVAIPAGVQLVVHGTAHLILCDGAKLSIEEPGIVASGEGHAAVAVAKPVASLAIYGQNLGSGMLVAKGGAGELQGYGGAGIGGDGTCPGGEVTINGGTVMAIGGKHAAGIGGGDNGWGGEVTINGGTVTAKGGDHAADIGSGAEGSGGTLTISGGAINASRMDGSIAISGGIFSTKPNDSWLATARSIVPNMDGTTADVYPWRVVASNAMVMLDSPLGPYETAAEATNVMAAAVFLPSEEVLGVLSAGAARGRYAGWFSLGVASKAADEWYVEAMLTDAAKTNLAETATAATRQIPVAGIAALAENATTNVTLVGCEPGFYYTLYGGPELADLSTTGAKYWSELCDADGTFAIPVVSKPSEAAGFFTIGVDAERPDNAGAVVFDREGNLFSGAVDFGGADGSSVSVWLENVKPKLAYGLGRSDTPVGPFVVEDGSWVRADDDGVLYEALTAPRIGPRSFYKIIVR